ncbi:MAG: hypothetical protein Q7U70_00825 [Methylotenera sp.]|nr:hypothetical protein [Methylotenera sp.]MDO9389319.1 hypothetical protein [Methylotenera sp.]
MSNEPSSIAELYSQYPSLEHDSELTKIANLISEKEKLNIRIKEINADIKIFLYSQIGKPKKGAPKKTDAIDYEALMKQINDKVTADKKNGISNTKSCRKIISDGVNHIPSINYVTINGWSKSLQNELIKWRKSPNNSI